MENGSALTSLEIAQRALKAATDHRVNCQVKLENARGEEQMAQRKVDDEIRKAAAAIPVDRSDRTLTDGSPVTADHREITPSGMQKGYVVLSEAERAKGFVRPVRDAYRHVGRQVCGKPGIHPTLKVQDLTQVCVMAPGHDGECRAFTEVKTIDQAERAFRQHLLGGCDQVTTMGRALAETYARDPNFYSGTFCSTCRDHFPVGANGEFVWYGFEPPTSQNQDGPRVGT